MATVNIGDQRVLVVRIDRDEVKSISDERRSVYENTKGKFIKTVNDGQIFLNDLNHAYIAYRRVQIPGRTYYRMVQYKPTTVEVENMLHTMFLNHGLDGFIK
jgi:hypothetical protein